MNSTESPIKNKKRILLVDDHPSMTGLWRLMLEFTGGYIVREVNQSLRAMEAARDFQPDLFLLDIDMPELDGPDIARLIRSDKDMRRTPILFLSSLVSPGEAQAGQRVDGHRCLPKPTGMDELVQNIEDTLALAC